MTRSSLCNWFAALLLLAACGGESGDGGNAPATAIGPAGGTLAHPTGAQLVVPASALAQAVELRIDTSSAGAPALPSGLTPAGQVFALTPHGTGFATPATLTIPFDSAQAPADAVPVLFKTDTAGPWLPVAGTSTAGTSISAPVSSLSWFVAAVGTTLHVITSTPATAQGPLAFSSTTVVDLPAQGGMRTVATLVGTTAGGLPARLELSWDAGTGANVQIQLDWGDAPASIAYCAPDSSNPCAGVVVRLAPRHIGIVMPETQLIFGGDPSIRARIAGAVALTQQLLMPTITRQPADVTVAAGENANFDVVSTGTGLAYQWQRSDDGGATYSPIAGAVAASYTLLNAAAGDNGARFRVAITGSAGTTTSNAALLTVTAMPVAPSITTQPQSVTVPAGSNANFNVVATGTPPLAYQWHKNGAPVGGNSSTLSFVAAPADDNASIDVTVSNASGSVGSVNAVLHVTVTAPAPLAPLQLAGGHRASYARGASGALYSWGSDLGEALGNDTAGSRNVPGPVSDVSDAIALAKNYGSSGHGLAIRASGEVWGWGTKNSGQLGTGTTTSAARPTAMKDGSGIPIGNAVATCAGVSQSLVLRADGTVLAAGTYPGDGTTTFRSFAAPVPGLSGIVALACGAGTSYALRSDGTLWAWGENTMGELGDGTTTVRSAPVQVSGLGGNIVAVAAGAGFALALDANGEVWAWGTNASGQLGDASGLPSRALPGRVSIAGVKAIAAGREHAIALMFDGSLRAWGENGLGQLGVGDQTDRLLPTPVGGPGVVVEVAGAGDHTLALNVLGEVWAWGNNISGQLGLGSTVSIFRTPQRLTLNLN